MRTMTIWLDDDYEAVEQEDATHVEIVQYDNDGMLINRTYGDINTSADDVAQATAEVIAADMTEEELEALLNTED